MSRLSQGWLWTDFAALAITPALFTPLLFKFYLFLAMLVLHYCTWAFSSCREWGLLSSFSVWASHCSGFSCRGAWPLVRMGFIGARWKSSLYTHSLICRGFHSGLGRQYLVLVVLPPWPPGRQISAPRGCIVHHQWELSWEKAGSSHTRGHLPHRHSSVEGSSPPPLPRLSNSCSTQQPAFRHVSEKPSIVDQYYCFSPAALPVLPCSGWVSYTARSLAQAPQHHPYQRNRDNEEAE